MRLVLLHITLLLFIVIKGFSQTTYEYVVTTASMNEFDVLGNKDYETNLNVDDNITKELHVIVGSDVKTDSTSEFDFSANNTIDGNMQTAWLTPKLGVDAQIEFVINLENINEVKSATLFQLSLFNGWRKDYNTWRDYGRIKKMLLLLNDKPFAEITLEDTYKQQYIELDNLKLEKNRRYRFRIRIMEVYAGKAHQQTALSDVQFSGKLK